MNTTENNVLIAEFLGFQKTDLGWFDFEETLSKCETDNTFDVLKFDSDWNWLMAVVLKINTLDDFDYNVRIQTMDCCIEDNIGWRIVDINCKYNPDELIKSVYEAVVYFIEWYNEFIS